MNRNNNLFDIMQQYIPEDNLCGVNNSPDILQNVKHQLFDRKEVDFMKIKIRKIAVAAVLAITLLAGGTIGVDAATGGHLMNKVKKMAQPNIEISDPDYHYKKDGVDVKIKKYSDDYDIEIKKQEVKETDDEKKASTTIIIKEAKKNANK